MSLCHYDLNPKEHRPRTLARLKSNVKMTGNFTWENKTGKANLQTPKEEKLNRDERRVGPTDFIIYSKTIIKSCGVRRNVDIQIKGN